MTLLLLGSLALGIGLNGLSDMSQPVQCSTPGNPDCLPIPGEHATYRDAVALGVALLAVACVSAALGLVARRRSRRLEEGLDEPLPAGRS